MTIELTLLTSVSHRGKEITAPRLRGLLALLAGEPRAGCGTGRLVAGLWPDEQPENPTKALQILVSRARSLLGGEVIASTPTGYRIALREDQVDAWAVQLHADASAEKARAGDHHGAVAEAEAGLALWDGGPAGGVVLGDPLVDLRLELGAAHLALTRLRALSLARAGRRGATERGVRLLALADRYRALRNFQPTMSSALSREAAANADKATYEDAVSTYAALDREALREAVLALLDPGR